MLNWVRLSLAQVLLLTALVALIVTLIGIMNRRFSVMYNDASLAISPDGEYLATGLACRPLFGRKHPVLVKSLREPAVPAKTYESHSWLVSDVAYSKDGSLLYSSGGRSIRIWDVAKGTEIARIDTGTHGSRCLAVSPDGKTIVIGGSNEVTVWDVESKSLIAQLLGHTSLLEAVVFSPDGKYLASGGHDAVLRIWDTETWRLENAITTTSRPTTMVFLPDGTLVTRGYRPKTGQQPWQCNATIYEIPSGDVLDELPVNSYAAVSSIAVSPDARRLAVAHGGDRELAHCAVTIWNVETKQELATLEVYDHGDCWIEAMEFSPDGEILYCGSHNNVITAQKWRDASSTVVFANNRTIPWRLGVGGGLLWLVAWYLAPRLPKAQDSKVHVGPLERVGTL